MPLPQVEAGTEWTNPSFTLSALFTAENLTPVKAVLAALPQIRDDVADVAQAALRQLQVRTRVSPEEGTKHLFSPLCDSLPLR